MSNNLLKAGWVNLNSEKKRIIDSNDLVAQKLESAASYPDDGITAWSGENFDEQDGTVPDEQVNGLLENVEEGQEPEEMQQSDFEDASAAEPSGNVLHARNRQPAGPTREEILAEAQEEINQMKQEAQSQIDTERAAAMEEARAQGHDEGYQAGYQEGQAQGREAAEEQTKAEVLERVKEMQSDYESKMMELEPLFVDHLTRIYEHIFHTDLVDDREIIIHLLDTALHGVDSGRDFIIRVSKEDYPFVSMQKKKLLSTLSNATMEVVEDLTLKKNECLIETGGGIFDCSVDVELFSLRKNLSMLAYEGLKERN